ncbi:AMP-binding protein [Xenorhabdus nematophila]|uniref:AMP-binding protein n=2 Tax=Xenorhabdus nematophila TaxID=628 RepID=UPI0005444FFF|nr:AMP-binding protein [Xenorhabdus nematophila]MBA0017890.1 AMP-binding protein [Xenorhabdus nematophila]MCB4426390.1 AMP-binding protein [Xenorhabdus nematophila]QNJ36955.1 AMP-binding protein [Xenorhabdus nematophila]CEF29664.1 EhpM [Xenorhabdus nematophila str. Websteri]
MKNNIDSWQINTGLKILNDALISTLEEKPDAKALVHAEKVYSYYQLIFSADMLAKQFNEIGIVEGDRIALDAPRSSELFIAIVACLLSGISFISVPRAIEKKQKMKFAVQTNCVALFSLSSEFIELGAQSFGVGNVLMLPDTYPLREPHQLSGKEIYCVRTSGTTGEPKIVPIYVRQLQAFLDNILGEFAIPQERRWLWIHDLSFDLSIWETIGSLVHRGCLVVLEEEDKREPSLIWQVLERREINQIMVTPSEFRYIFSENYISDFTRLSLNEVLFCGEKLSVETLKPFFSTFQSQKVKLVNTYGPSEATIFCSAHTVTENDLQAGSIPIGKPFPNMHFSLESQENDGSGDLLLEGEQVFEGYDGRLLERNGYLTGDICRCDNQGEYHYIGRRGGFHKINGFRVDLLEVEEFLQSIPGVGEAVVWINETSENPFLLCACINVMADVTLSTRDLRMACTQLATWLRPARYLIVPQNEWPMNIRGKTDRAELKRRLYEK